MKLVGILLIFITFSSLAIYSSKKEKNKIIQLQDIFNLMKHIRNQIDYFNRPIQEIYQSFQPIHQDTEKFIFNLSNNDWTSAVKTVDNSINSPEISKILIEFGQSLGKSNKEQQVAHCDYYIGLYQKEFEEIKTKSPDKIKTTVALWIYVGLMLIILFL